MKNLLILENNNAAESPFNLTTLIIIIAVTVVVLVGVLIVLLNLLRKKKKANILNSSGPWLLALGGKENVKEVTAVGSRLSVNLVDKENIDREKLKELGVSSVLVMSNKVTLVIEDKAEKVASTIQKEL